MTKEMQMAYHVDIALALQILQERDTVSQQSNVGYGAAKERT